MNFTLPNNKLTLYLIMRFVREIEHGALFLTILLTTYKVPIDVSGQIDDIKKQVESLSDAQIKMIFDQEPIQNMKAIISSSLYLVLDQNPDKFKQFIELLKSENTTQAMMQIDDIKQIDEETLHQIRESIKNK